MLFYNVDFNMLYFWKCFLCLIFEWSVQNNHRNTRKNCETCSKLTIKKQKDVIDIVLVFLLLNLNIFHAFFNVSFVDFEQAG